MNGLPDGYRFGVMTPHEVRTIAQWAADEQWNPGVHDIDIAHSFDPEAFIALRDGDEMVGGGSILSYGACGFMGLFIMKPELRGLGLGGALWHQRLRMLRDRIPSTGSIGMDGVFAMVPFYSKGGFVLSHRDLRFDGTALASPDQDLTPVREVGIEAVLRYDEQFFPVSRAGFLGAWVNHPDFRSAVVLEEGEVVGCATLRPCVRGFRFGPVHADRPDIAERLLRGLMSEVVGQPVQLDVPEPNEAGLSLAASFGMTESFGCARMYHGPVPAVPLHRMFGVTSFEFG